MEGTFYLSSDGGKRSRTSNLTRRHITLTRHLSPPALSPAPSPRMMQSLSGEGADADGALGHRGRRGARDSAGKQLAARSLSLPLSSARGPLSPKVFGRRQGTR
jgi:hypothetical protein